MKRDIEAMREGLEIDRLSFERIYRDSMNRKLRQGVLDHKVSTVLRSHGTEKLVENLVVTAKGLTRLDEDEKDVVIADTLGGQQDVSALNIPAPLETNREAALRSTDSTTTGIVIVAFPWTKEKGASSSEHPWPITKTERGLVLPCFN